MCLACIVTITFHDFHPADILKASLTYITDMRLFAKTLAVAIFF